MQIPSERRGKLPPVTPSQPLQDQDCPPSGVAGLKVVRLRGGMSSSSSPPMSTVESLLAAIPDDPLAAFVLADYLEEQGNPQSELLRLVFTLTRAIEVSGRGQLEGRLRELLEQGIKPIGPYRSVQLDAGTSMTFAWVPPGTFLMGRPAGERGQVDEVPQHRVTLTKGFFLGVHQVTQAQWQAVMGSNPSHFQGKNQPVETVSWEDCQEFCRKLGERDGQKYRLPTEAEWEYACRAGTTTEYCSGFTSGC